MTSTPRRDAVELWLRSGRVGPIEWTRDFDPCAGMSDPERLAYVITHAGSGAPADLPAAPRKGIVTDTPRRPRRWLKRRTP